MQSRLLVVASGDAAWCAPVERMLSERGYAVVRARRDDAQRMIDAGGVDLVIVDLDATDAPRRTAVDVPVVGTTERDDFEHVTRAMRDGMFDVWKRPLEPERDVPRLERALGERRLRRELALARAHALERATDVATLLGDSTAMRRVHELVLRVAESEASVLIHGETGTGKELVARAVHAHGPRRDGPFVALNCAAVPAPLLESELFGHAKGAFTDAKTSRVGLFAKASGGTLFLDEIGEMPLEMQPKLLRVLQERTVRPVGGDEEIPFDTRIVTATHRDLERAAEEGTFRRDLYYRIHVVRIDVPPLRDRGNDVLRLASHFLATYATREHHPEVVISTQVAERLLAYDWPGNVRELENCIERAVALAHGDRLTVDDLPEKVRLFRPGRADPLPEGAESIVTLEALERSYIDRVLTLLDGNKSRAADLLGLDRRTLYRRLERYAQRATGERRDVGEPGTCAGEVESVA